MVRTSNKTLTLEAFLQQPETEPASEYIDGAAIQKPMPQGKHSRLQKEVVFAIGSVVKPARVAEAFPELRCTFGGRSIVPDIAVFRWERIPVESSGAIANSFTAAPDWTIEILSPDQRYSTVTSNILHCLDHGCEMGWLIDPDEQLVITYPSDARSRSFSQATDPLPTPTWAAGLQLSVEQLFGWLTV